MRAFIALPVPDAVTRHAAALRKALTCRGVAGKWVRPENVHLTLHFLGEVDGSALERLREQLAGLASGVMSLRFGYKGVAGFGRPPKLLCTAWEDLGRVAFEELVGRIQESVRDAGLDVTRTARKRRPVPHVTVVRFRGPHEAGTLRSIVRIRGKEWDWQIPLPVPEETSMEVSRLCLCRSTLTPNGAIYDELESFRLGES